MQANHSDCRCTIPRVRVPVQDILRIINGTDIVGNDSVQEHTRSHTIIPGWQLHTWHCCWQLRSANTRTLVLRWTKTVITHSLDAKVVSTGRMYTEWNGSPCFMHHPVAQSCGNYCTIVYVTDAVSVPTDVGISPHCRTLLRVTWPTVST